MTPAQGRARPALPRLPPLLDRVVEHVPSPRRIVVLLTAYDGSIPEQISQRFPDAQLRVLCTSALPAGVDPATAVHTPDLESRMQDLAPRERPDVILDLGWTPGQKSSSLRHLFYLLRPQGLYVVGLLSTAHDTPPDGKPTVLDVLLAAQSAATMSPDQRRAAPRADVELAVAMSSLTLEGPTAYLTKRGEHFLKLRDSASDAILARRAGHRAPEVLERRAAHRFVSESSVTSHGDGPIATGRTELDVPELVLRRYQDVRATARQIVRQDDLVLPDSWRHPHQRVLNNRQLAFSSPWFGRYTANTTPQSHRDLEGAYYYLDTELPGHFGHITTDVLSRVWGWRAALRLDPDLRPLLSVSTHATRVPDFQNQMFAALGIDLDDAEVIQPREEVRVPTLYGASPQLENPTYIDPGIVEVWRELSAGLPDRPLPSVSERVFVSRRTGGKRDCVNVGEVEEAFVRAGFSVVFPEDHDYATQHAIFRQTKVLAGFGGSGMFTMMFAPDAQVFLVSGHSYTAANERLIAAANGNELHYVWGRSEVTAPSDRFSLEAFTSDFRVDVRLLRRVLRRELR